MRSDVQEMTGPVLEILSGELAGRSYAIDAKEFYIGRSTSCDLVIPKRYISREHAKLVRGRRGEWRIDGLSEKNPVFLQGQAARGEQLQDGDVFEMCGIQFRFRLEGRVEGRRQSAQRMSGSYRDDDDGWGDADTVQYDRREISGSGPARGRQEVSDSGPVRGRQEVSDSGPLPGRGRQASARRAAADDSWADPSDVGAAPARDPSDVGGADDSWSTGPAAAPAARSGARSGAHSNRVVFEVDDEEAPLAASGSKPDANEQTAELGKADPDDPDYDPFAEVELQKKTKKVDPGREKALKALLVVGLGGLAFAGYFLYVITRPKPWQQIDVPTPIKVAVDEVKEFTYEWSYEDEPEGRRGTSRDGREYEWWDDDYVHVEWAVPHVLSRTVFLIRGKAEGPSKFVLTFPRSRRHVVFTINVEGESPHRRFREERVETLAAKPARELRRDVEKHTGSGKRLTEEFNVEGKEGYHRRALEEFQAATDAAQALLRSLSSRGVVPKDDQQLALACEDREKAAETDYEGFVSREIAIYQASVQHDSEDEQEKQLKRLLRAINHPCDERYKRLKLILEECFEGRLRGSQPTCPAER